MGNCCKAIDSMIDSAVDMTNDAIEDPKTLWQGGKPVPKAQSKLAKYSVPADGAQQGVPAQTAMQPPAAAPAALPAEATPTPQ
eukprot:NODE_2122_length_673_cov_129.838141_g1789_i0.p4 GENE.NODE_2122_length_673_cov_129.838141_g1789_i0~~NODE_2122_length_673_cov_129.838141_g1789_i0.p4  ORF type:complete len:83 (-),score=2.21 NODE_2122_length_673_cov_129.838141_g1789_i0:343-591(-)